MPHHFWAGRWKTNLDHEACDSGAKNTIPIAKKYADYEAITRTTLQDFVEIAEKHHKTIVFVSVFLKTYTTPTLNMKNVFRKIYLGKITVSLLRPALHIFPPHIWKA